MRFLSRVGKVAVPALMLASMSSAQLLSGVNLDVIKVGKVGISQGKIDSLSRMLAAQQGQGRQLPPEGMTQVRWAVIDNLVGQELLKLEVEKQGLKASTQKVDSLLALFKGQFPNEETFNKELKKSGTTLAEFKKKIENQVMSDMILEKKVAYPKDPTDKDVADYWAKHKAEAQINDTISGAKIVLNLAKGESAQAIQDKKDMLKGLAAQVRANRASFAMLAAQNSDEADAKKTGGVMQGFLAKNEGAEFVAAVKNLKVGEISEPFVSKNSVMIFMLTEKNDGKMESYKHKIDYILRMEAERNRQQAIKSYLDQLGKTYKVQYLNKDYTPPEAIGQ